MVARTSEGGGRMMLRTPIVRTISSHATKPATVNSVGQNALWKWFDTLAGMAGLDRSAQVAHEPVEALVLGHGDIARARQIDLRFLDDGRRPPPHHQHAVRQQHSFADTMGDEHDR